MNSILTGELTLESRIGLPEGMAYLLESHPQYGWRKHINFGQLAEFWLHIHATLRQEGAMVLETVEMFQQKETDPMQFRNRFSPQLNQFLAHLENHHRIEDGIYFPKFQKLDPRMVVGFDLLEADHIAIHDRVLAMVDGARTLLSALSVPGIASLHAADAFVESTVGSLAVLSRHLADEEELVIPALLEHGEQAVR